MKKYYAFKNDPSQVFKLEDVTHFTQESFVATLVHLKSGAKIHLNKICFDLLFAPAPIQFVVGDNGHAIKSGSYWYNVGPEGEYEFIQVLVDNSDS